MPHDETGSVSVTTRQLSPTTWRLEALSSIYSLLENLPEYTPCGLDCVKWKYNLRTYTFRDEDGVEHVLDSAKVEALVTKLETMDLPRGLTPLPRSPSADAWEDWECQSDADTVDYLVQMALFGEIVYG